MSGFRKMILCLVIIFISSIILSVSGYNSATISNNASLAIAEHDNALVAVPEAQVIGADNKITVINNTSENLFVRVPEVTQNGITVKGNDYSIGTGTSLVPVDITGNNGPINITVAARTFSGEFKAEVSSIIQINK